MSVTNCFANSSGILLSPLPAPPFAPSAVLLFFAAVARLATAAFSDRPLDALVDGFDAAVPCAAAEASSRAFARAAATLPNTSAPLVQSPAVMVSPFTTRMFWVWKAR